MMDDQALLYILQILAFNNLLHEFFAYILDELGPRLQTFRSVNAFFQGALPPCPNFQGGYGSSIPPVPGAAEVLKFWGGTIN